MSPRAVILDFDGVVVDSLGAHLAAWVEATRRVFRRTLEEPETLSGRATRAIAGLIATRYGDPSLGSTLAKVKEGLLIDRLGEVRLLPGARELIELARARGLPHGIASNSPRPFVHAALAHLQLAVDAVVCGDEVSRGKPRPDIFWECGRRLGVSPEERAAVLVFEDSAHGLTAARAAGMVPLGLTTEQSAERLLAAGAVATCTNLAEALAHGWLERLPPLPRASRPRSSGPGSP